MPATNTMTNEASAPKMVVPQLKALIRRPPTWPSCKPGAERQAERMEGQLLDLDEFNVEDDGDQPKTRPSTKPSNDFTFQGFDLRVWAAQYGATFEVEHALRSGTRLPSDLFRDTRHAGGVHIQCPFEDEHS